ncbi:MAG: PEP-utilizing enzyme [Candidatus Moranbacteria bacterium]|nr:PEP-utilizing enzyme [Candidatus Moranbacteria bacterium]
MAKWEKIASDYHCNFWKNYCFVKGAALQPELIDIQQVHLGIRAWPKTIDYLYLPETWKRGHRKLAQLASRDVSLVEKILKKTKLNGERMNAFTESFVRENLTKYSNKKIVESLKKHANFNSLEYAWGILIPILDFQDVHYIEDNLKAILGRKLSKAQAERAFFIFTQPLHDSFALEQEKSILKIFQKIPKKLLEKDAKDILEKLEARYPAISRELRNHVKKYAWVFYVYSGPAATEKDFVETLKFYAKKKTNAVKKLRKMENGRNKLLEEREYFFQKMKLGKKERKTVELAAEVVYLKPRRKDYQTKSYYHLEFLQREIGRRLHLSLSQVRSCAFQEIKSSLRGRKIDVHEINKRTEYHIVVPSGKEIKIYSGKKAKEFEKNIREERVEIGIKKEIEGQSAFPGTARGLVKRVDIPGDMKKMKEGDILVSTATTPSIIPAIRKAAAIVTDEGGLTCHAAIVSREFEIPCVIGTKFATKILKDGDLAAVDATTGKVKIIKKAKK